MEFVQTVKMGLKSKSHTDFNVWITDGDREQERGRESEVKNVKQRNIKLGRMCGESERGRFYWKRTNSDCFLAGLDGSLLASVVGQFRGCLPKYLPLWI